MSTQIQTQYDDEVLASLVGETLIDEPMINAAELQPTVHNGVVTLGGRVANPILQDRIIEAVRRALDASGTAYASIDNQLVVG